MSYLRQTRIAVTSNNLSSWLCNLPLISSAIGPEHHATLNNVLRISPGDTVYISRRHAIPQVC